MKRPKSKSRGEDVTIASGTEEAGIPAVKKQDRKKRKDGDKRKHKEKKRDEQNQEKG